MFVFGRINSIVIVFIGVLMGYLRRSWIVFDLCNIIIMKNLNVDLLDLFFGLLLVSLLFFVLVNNNNNNVSDLFFEIFFSFYFFKWILFYFVLVRVVLLKKIY